MKRDSSNGPKPFLKWVGGKTQLLPELEARLPADFARSVRVYAEPFVGGGALLFHLLSKGLRPERIVVNDSNPDLANAWRVVQRHADGLVEALARFETDYHGLPDESAKRSFYLGVRCSFNAGRADTGSADVARAAELLFLNRTCFNGLYRVNAKGWFNVPFGKYANPSICDEPTIRAASAALTGAEILCVDFAEAVKHAGPGWFVYFDPPYRPISATSAFCDYTQGGFGDEEQRRLADVCRALDESGVRWLLSNSDPPDGFFDGLYRGFRIDRVRAARAINSKGDGRGKISEIIVSNGKERG
jgi:DNA adenine methylase